MIPDDSEASFFLFLQTVRFVFKAPAGSECTTEEREVDVG